MSIEQDRTHTAEFGMIGLAVMGRNLALNVADQGIRVAVWNLEPDVTDSFMREQGASGRFTATHTFAELTQSMSRPRRIMMMIKAGDPVDKTIEALAPLLDAGDILIDGGNSWFRDTQRREATLRTAGVNFFGAGVSGGEEGARHGPSLMPGGPRPSYEHVRAIFEAIAAKTDSGACTTYVGPDGAGHFVKMVHNGIEYGDMQLIAEAYDILHRGLGMKASELADTFAAWNQGPLESFLIEITSDIFGVRDEETGTPLIDLVLDKAGQKGTGKWTAQVALDLAIPIPTIAAAIDARVMSSMKAERVAASQRLRGPTAAPLTGDHQTRIDYIRDVHDALYASKMCAYAQGMRLIHAGSEEHHWNISLQEMARIWKGGCIIRARFLNDIMSAYERQPDLPNLLLDEKFTSELQQTQSAWRRVVTMAQQAGLAVPAMTASLAYFDAYRTERLPQNLTQAQRDYFGAHTYERADKPEAGFVHTAWVAPSLDRRERQNGAVGSS